MSELLKEMLAPGSLSFRWTAHNDAIQIGPFHFDEEIPVPVGAKENQFVNYLWIDVPFANRGNLSRDRENTPIEEIDGVELVQAIEQGHLPQNAADYTRLVDHVGRCLLIVSVFLKDEPFHDMMEKIFAHAEHGHEVYHSMIQQAKEYVQNGIALAEQGREQEALLQFVVARLQYQGAHLLSPTTAGILYELGVLHFDLANRFDVKDIEALDTNWKHTMSMESRYYLELAMGAKDMQDETPGFYLLGVTREILDDLDGAKSAYERFLNSPAARKFSAIKDASLERLKGLE